MTPSPRSRSKHGSSVGMGVALLAGILLVVGVIGVASGSRGSDRPPAVLLPPTATPQPTPTATPTDPPWIVRVPRPTIPLGPRRIAIQAGHWKQNEVPEEQAKLREFGGGVFGDFAEWEFALDIAERVAAKLRANGYVVDVLPAAIPERYLADAFVSLHADFDVTGTARGFKVAHGVRRTPYDEALTEILAEEYARATRLPVDPNVTEDMWDYYAFRWERFRAVLDPHTPATILEMGFLTSAADRAVLFGRRDMVADGIVNGVVRFLNEVPGSALFRDDLVLPRRTPEPSRTP